MPESSTSDTSATPPPEPSQTGGGPTDTNNATPPPPPNNVNVNNILEYFYDTEDTPLNIVVENGHIKLASKFNFLKITLFLLLNRHLNIAYKHTFIMNI